MKLFPALIAGMIFAFPASSEEKCNTFSAAATDRGATYVIVKDASVVVGFFGEEKTYHQAIEKRFGYLVATTISHLGKNAESRPFVIIEDKGQPRRLVYEGVVFTENCEVPD